MESGDLILIKEGLVWLSDNIQFRAGKEKEDQKQANIYATKQLRVVRRILDFVETQDDAVVILIRELLELELHEDVKDLAMISVMGKREISTFSRYEQSLITKAIFGKGSRWANLA